MAKKKKAAPKKKKKIPVKKKKQVKKTVKRIYKKKYNTPAEIKANKEEIRSKKAKYYQVNKKHLSALIKTYKKKVKAGKIIPKKRPPKKTNISKKERTEQKRVWGVNRREAERLRKIEEFNKNFESDYGPQK